jgi:hypothetical protein
MLGHKRTRMASDPAVLIRVCSLCQLIHDDGETAYERWVTRDVYKMANGFSESADPLKAA